MGEAITQNNVSDVLMANFSPRFYRRHYGNVEVHQKGELGHYISKGESAGNMPVEYFSPVWWKATYGLDNGKFSTAFENFLIDHRDTAPSESYQIIRQSCFAVDDDYSHAMTNNEFSFSGLIDFEFIKLQNTQNLAAPDPICLYLRMIGEGAPVSPAWWFDPAYYWAEYPDVANAGTEAFTHFVRHGIFENRRPSKFLRPKLDGTRYEGCNIEFLRSIRSINELFELEPPFELDSIRPDALHIERGSQVHVPANAFFGEPVIHDTADFEVMVEVYRSFMEKS